MKKICAFLLSIFFVSMNFAQVSDTVKVENKRFDFQYQKLYVPAGLMISGIIADGRGKESLKNEIVEERNEHLFGFENHLDDYAQFLPFGAIYGFEIVGIKPRTDWKNRTAIMVKGQILNLGLVYILKKSLKEPRPDGTAYSFPSGHTANVFAGATMLAIEYGEHHKWVPYAAYGVATTVGAMRMINNKHYISDVLFGAGLGILSMKAAYWTHQYKWNRPKSDHDPLTALYTLPEN